jgi:hypothetical protein
MFAIFSSEPGTTITILVTGPSSFITDFGSQNILISNTQIHSGK